MVPKWISWQNSLWCQNGLAKIADTTEWNIKYSLSPVECFSDVMKTLLNCVQYSIVLHNDHDNNAYKNAVCIMAVLTSGSKEIEHCPFSENLAECQGGNTSSAGES